MLNSATSWYQQLIRPSWAPPAWLFGPVWSVLYVGIAVSFGAVFVLAARGKISWWIALPFLLNLIFNFAFTPLQFGLRRNVLAAVDILLVLATAVWATLAVRSSVPWVAWAQVPYLVWVAFATALQLTITWTNR